MRRLPRLRSAAAAGFLPASTPSGALRAPAAAAFGSPSTLSSTPRLTTSSPLQRQAQRSLSTTPTRRAQPQSQAEPHAAAAEEQQDDQLATYPDEDLYPPPAAAAEIPTQLVYPRQLTTAPAAADVTDPAYRPADTADGLEEVGGLADWWEQPAHWGDAEGGPGRLVHAVVNPFGPVARVADPVVLEVLARRAVVEALAVAGARVKRKVVDRLFAASADGLHGLEEVLRVEIVAGPDGAAALSTEGGKRVWEVLQSATARKEVQQPREQQQAPAAEVEKAQETEVEVVQEEVQASEVLNDETVAPATKLAPSEAEALIQSWSREWRKAELRDPVVKFFAAKRIQQLTGHRIPDGKLVAINTIDSLLKQLVEPPKPKKLAELMQTSGLFQDLPNVRVFPRRVTPIDKEKMVGRWKIIVKELEKRDLPVIGTGDHAAAVEKKWIEGRA